MGCSRDTTGAVLAQSNDFAVRAARAGAGTPDGAPCRQPILAKATKPQSVSQAPIARGMRAVSAGTHAAKRASQARGRFELC